MIKPVELEFHVGHYGDGTGAKKLVDEVKYARKFIKRIYDICIANGVPATFYEDKVSKKQTQNINNLVTHHNKDANGFIVSGHLNASDVIVDKSIGVEVLYYDQASVAKKVADAICNASGMTNRGAKKRTDVGVLASTDEPAILIEFGFVNSRKDVELMNQNFEAICQAVSKELAAVVGKSIKPPAVYKANDKIGYNIAKDATAFRFQSGKFNSKEDAVKAVEKAIQAGIISYATVIGTTK